MKSVESMVVRPYELVHIVCAIGKGQSEDTGSPRLNAILAAARKNPLLPLELRANVDSLYRYQNPGRELDTAEGDLFNDRRDLHILQRLGMVPGDTRPALMLFSRLLDQMENISDAIAGQPGSAVWKDDLFATQADYAKGREKGLGAILPLRKEDEKARVKAETAKAVIEADHLYIRPHHTMCMSCFYGRQMEKDGKLSPIAEDNLYEAIVAIHENPEIPVTLIQGPCQICPPCHGYDPETNLCVALTSMGLRDQKKDLDWLYRMNMNYGDIIPARDLFKKLYDTIASTTEVCGNCTGVATAREWRICGGPDGEVGYVRARKDKLGIPGL